MGLSLVLRGLGSVQGGRRAAYLFADDAQLLPHQPRQDVLEERQVQLGFDDFEFRVPGVQREGGGLRFAGFYRAGEEVECEELHGGGLQCGRVEVS